MKNIFIFILVCFGFLAPAYADQVCTMDAKMCSDGSYVGRTGPNCEFAACAGESTSTGNLDDTKVCTMQYAPVCGEVQVQCIKAPCYPVKETFGNMCELGNNPNAKYLYDGECKTDSSTGTVITNPAADYCGTVGGQSQTMTKPDGTEYGVCVFEEGRMCEENALYKGDCSVGGRKLTGYLGEYAKYCAITGNEFVYKSMDSSGNDIGDCKLKSGEVINAVTFYNSGVTQITDPSPDMTVCTMIYSPVCGNDGKTYGNSCTAGNVGVKYNGVCMSQNLEKKIDTAWNKAIKNAVGNLDAVQIARVLENVYNNAITFGKNYGLESIQSSLYNYISTIAYNTLHKSIYEPFIKTNISKISTQVSPIGLTFIVTKIEWIDLNTATVTYSDGNVTYTTKIEIRVSNNQIVTQEL